MPLRAAELEVLVTVDDKQIAAAEKNIKATGQRVEKSPIKVDADAKGALASMDRVEKEAKRIVSQRTMATVDANIDRAEKAFVRVKERLDYLQSVSPELDVKADVARAEASMQKVERQLNALRSAKATMEVDVDTPAPETYRKPGEDAGETFGKEMIAALVSIPIAGAVIGVGAAAARGLLSAFQEGLQIEKGYDRLAALTGLDEAAAIRIGSAAGEAYANTFGESIEANMDTARLALQFDLIDDNATTAQAQRVIQSLAGIADVLGEDVQPVAQAVTQMLRTGIAKSADEAFDVLAAGAREGTNRAEDLLDTFTEYPALFKRLGISGPEALGLITQGLKAGARNSDLAADALKEFQIRATDASDSSAAGFEAIGLNAEEMTAKIAAGGAGAREGLDQVLDGLRAMEDPVARNAAAVALFGTQAEDLGDALFAMDLTNAVDQLNGVSGAAQRMFETLSSNTATKVEQAQRNIEVAADGIKGALAVAFSEPLGDFADWVSENRGPLLQFFSDLVNGAIDFGVTATQAFGDFVSGPLAEVVEGIAGVIDVFNGNEGRPKELDDLAAGMRDFKSGTDDAVAGLEAMREKFNGFADGQVALGYLNDASLRLADAVGQVGSETGTMEEQVRSAIAALGDQVAAAEAAGEGQEALSQRYAAGTQALLDQMVQTGMTREEAQALIDTVMSTPESKSTTFSSNAQEQQGKVQALADRVTTLPNGTIVISADTSQAYSNLMSLQSLLREVTGNKSLHIATGLGGQGGLTNARGNLVEFYRDGGLRGLSPMQPVAQMVPANTWRVVGDRGDVPELYAPLDGSARSWALILEGLRRMPGQPPQLMGDGGFSYDQARAASQANVAAPSVQVFIGDEEISGRVRVVVKEEIGRGVRSARLGGGR